jgi:actin-related protein 6
MIIQPLCARSVFPNCTARLKGERALLVGDAVLGVKDVASLSLRRPVDRGYVVTWDVQKEVWLR